MGQVGQKKLSKKAVGQHNYTTLEAGHPYTTKTTIVVAQRNRTNCISEQITLV